MTMQTMPASSWLEMKCCHIGKEGCWSQEMVARQLVEFPAWQVLYDASGSNPRLTRRFDLSNFESVKLALKDIIDLADKEDHHPEVSFSYGYVEVSWNTHSAGGLSNNDWVCVAKTDQALKFLG